MKYYNLEKPPEHEIDKDFPHNIVAIPVLRF